MILIPLILSATLDLSLPEFQPGLDASGNYITAYYDEDLEEPVVEYIPEEDFAEDGGFSPSAEVLDDEPVLEESPIEETPILRSSNTVTINSTPLANRTISVYNMQIRNSNGNTIYYIPMTAGVEYTLSGVSVIYYSYSLDVYSTVYTQTFSNTFTPESNCYFLCVSEFSASYVDSGSGGDEPTPDPSGNDPGGDTSSGGDFDDTNIVSKLDEIKVVLRAICFICLINFLYPICLDIKDNIVGGDKNV